MIYTIKLQDKYAMRVESARTFRKAERLLKSHKGYGYVLQYGNPVPVLVKAK